MRAIIIAALATVLLLLIATTASAYDYLSPVNPGSVAYTTSYWPAGTAYAYPTYTVASPVVVESAYPYAVQRPYYVQRPYIAQRPFVAVPGPVVYPAPVYVAPRVFVPGQPVRNVVRGIFPY